MTDILELSEKAGFEHVGKVNISALQPLNEVRDMCNADRCQSFGRNWACPPACGSIEHCEKRIHAYSEGVLVQTTTQLDDEFDFEGIKNAAKLHKDRFETLVRQVRSMHPNCLPLSAGACTRCVKCTYPDKPCRYPTKRLSSMEAYGLFVSDVCVKSGLKYNYGPKTISYSSCILF